MSCGIKIENCFDVSFTDVSVVGFDVGMDVKDSADVRLNQVDFGDCTTGFRGRNISQLRATSCYHGSIRSSKSFSASDKICFNYSLQYLRAKGYNPY
ncbi:hypothetical protein AB4562_20000 [Vibrio sp. 10N.222.54.A1]|uniref:hypothetical protein n=1 Tax=unclassified Vibrio TaxID=2614977 RepID=UPI000C83ACB1|nr:MULTISPECIES: hypothetical protein [unclassified Vibrio]PMK78273.1 hypothetical protein BCT92_05075 [Vibrio sp. 10N.261.52.E5]TKF78502.1 hypothetical protein FCV65_23635 [Vibrio sp. F13]